MMRSFRSIFISLALISFAQFGLSEEYRNRPFYDSVLSNDSIGSFVATPYHLLYAHLDSGAEAESKSIIKSLAKMLFLELPLIHYAKFYQHELGHGFRARDFGKSSDYYFGLPYPYRLLTKDHDEPPGKTDVRGTLTTVEGSVVTIGGFEAELVLSQHLLDNAAQDSVLDRSIGNLYFVLKTSTLIYGDAKNESRHSDIRNANWAKDVRKKAMISLIDPMLWFAVRSNYLHVRGERSTLNPWFNLTENVKLLPSLSYYLIPYGESYEVQILSRVFENQVRLNLARWTFVNAFDNGASDIEGLFLRARYSGPLWKKMSSVIDLAISRQPYFGTDSWSETSSIWYSKVGVGYSMSDQSSLIAGAAYKPRGYMPHTTIKSGAIYSVGLHVPVF